jgi:hypothetical protein
MPLGEVTCDPASFLVSPPGSRCILCPPRATFGERESREDHQEGHPDPLGSEQILRSCLGKWSRPGKKIIDDTKGEFKLGEAGRRAG